jgi:hypothetical protein
MAWTDMRSPRGFIGSLILLLGAPLAAFAGIAFGGGAEIIIHLALGASFVLTALSVFDFNAPAWIARAAGMAIAVLAGIFLLQGASELLRSPPLSQIAYGFLGQRLEKILGYAFLAWCFALIVADSKGGTRAFGAAALLAVFCAELYPYLGGTAPELLKLLYLPLFFWLLLESRKLRRAVTATGWP